MSFKPLLLIFVLLIISCGSSKQITNVPKNNPIQIEEQKEDITIQGEIETIEIIETPSGIEADKPIPEAETEIIETNVTKVFNHDKWNSLLQRHVSSQGNVNYKGFFKDKSKLKSYTTELTKNLPENNWNKNQKLAYWINAYNALTIDLIIRNLPIQSIKDIKDPWDQRLWKFGSKWYNLNDIEHEILRKMDEPRIHFAIVCASVSCPKLQNFAFNKQELNEQLDLATKEFLEDSSKNNISENRIKLSKIFKWFSKDFKTNETSLIDFLNQYSDITISDKAKKSYKDYNWDLNE